MVEEFGEIEDFFEEGDGYSSGVVVEDDEGFGFVDGVEVQVLEMFELGLWEFSLHI